MTSARLKFLNRLQERGLIDQWGFAFFSAAGSIGIVLAKILSAPAVWVSLGAVGVMFLYAGLISRYGTGRLQSDQAGDNCYYLGLIFTLSSLAYAIFTFDPANTATTIVQGFGIALATTIFGLVLRVVFNQGRPDLEEVESSARHELIDAVTRLKTELGQSVVLMNDFGRQIRQSISETRDSTTKDLAQFAETAVSELQKAVQEAQAALVSEASSFTARTKRQGAVVDRLVTSLENHSVSLDRFGSFQEKASTALSDLSESAAKTLSAAEAINKETIAFSSATQRMTESTDSVHSSVTAVRSSIDALVIAVDDAQKRIHDEIERVRFGPSEIVKEAMEGLAKSSAVLREELTKLGGLQADVAKSINEQTKAATDAVRKHNEDLETNLGRSRGLVETVHENLVSMTAELVEQVEARR